MGGDVQFSPCWLGREGDQQELWTLRGTQTKIREQECQGFESSILGTSMWRDGSSGHRALHRGCCISAPPSLPPASIPAGCLRRGMGISRVKGKEGKAVFVFNLPH